MSGFPSNWTQEASQSLTAIAREGVSSAPEAPGYDVNPLQGKLQSAVRSDSQFGHDVITLCQQAWSLVAGNGVSA